MTNTTIDDAREALNRIYNERDLDGDLDMVRAFFDSAAALEERAKAAEAERDRAIELLRPLAGLWKWFLFSGSSRKAGWDRITPEVRDETAKAAQAASDFLQRSPAALGVVSRNAELSDLVETLTRENQKRQVIIETLTQVITETAQELDCEADNEAILQAISDLKSQFETLTRERDEALRRWQETAK